VNTAAPAVPPLRHVLACTDFSAPARQAAERAARIARAQGAELHLLHTVASGALDELTRWLGADTAPAQALLAQAGTDLQALADALRVVVPTGREAGGAARAGPTPGSTLPVHAHLDAGSVPAQAQRLADTLPADLVLLGARGAGTLRRLVLGTTADRLLRLLQQPVLVVRHPPQAAYRRVLVALDFSPWSMAAVQSARRVAPDASLVLLHVTQVPFGDKLRFAGVPEDTVAHYRRRAHAEALQQLHALAHDLGLGGAAWQPLVLEGEAWQQVLRAERQAQADLLVLGKHGRTAAADLLLGSVTRHVLAEGSADLLVCTARSTAAGTNP
jgi:nucleotide-binding universal stress UspA family protein